MTDKNKKTLLESFNSLLDKTLNTQKKLLIMGTKKQDSFELASDKTRITIEKEFDRISDFVNKINTPKANAPRGYYPPYPMCHFNKGVLVFTSYYDNADQGGGTCWVARTGLSISLNKNRNAFICKESGTFLGPEDTKEKVFYFKGNDITSAKESVVNEILIWLNGNANYEVKQILKPIKNKLIKNNYPKN